MRSSFFGLNVAQQGLYTSRTMLDITNHNISNAETEGYTRQYGVQKATRPMPNAQRGMVGTGTTIEQISQHRNEYLDHKFWNMNKDYGTYEVKSTMLQQMELIFNEPSEVGFTSYFDNMFETLQSLSKDPSDEANRANFLASAESFSQYITDLGKQLRGTQNDANFGVKNSVNQINSYAEQISTLNQQIRNLELNGNRANDLRDQRMVLVDKLSKVVGINYQVATDQYGMETINITINGQQLVSGNAFNTLELSTRETLDNPEDNPDIYDIKWNSGKNLYTDNLTGELKGYIDIRDGNNGNNFKGTVDSVDTINNTITLADANRFDIPMSGKLLIDGVPYEYDDYTYDEASNEVTLELNIATPATGVTAGNKVAMGHVNTFKGVPYYMQQLNKFVRTFASEFNTLQQSGNNGTGSPIFVYKGYDGSTPLDAGDMSSYTDMTIDNFIVNPAMVDDVSLLSTKSSASDGESANDIILAMIDKRQDTKMFAKGVPDNYMQSIISELGIDVSQMSSFRDGQEQLTRMITNQRLSISDVDLEEETINLLKYQQAYSMSAKIMSVFNEIYNVTINQMGV
jgi:flagellar hook-associated protein 1 FlgK